MRRALAVLALALGVALGAGACAAPAVEIPADAVVVDVRTPAEYAEGHLDGAVNVDVSAPTFDEQARQLDVDRAVVVYCRSGSRSAQAAARLGDLGFSRVIDAGSMDDAASITGRAIIVP